jgi:hypothetical protein
MIGQMDYIRTLPQLKTMGLIDISSGACCGTVWVYELKNDTWTAAGKDVMDENR